MTRFELAATIALLPAAVFAGPADELLEASRQNDLGRVLSLIDATDINAADINHMTALHVAAGFGYTELAVALVERGADINVRAALGKTPLMLAAQEGHTDIARLLIDAGAMTDLRDDAGATALTWARGYGHRDIVTALQPVSAPVFAPIDAPVASWKWVVTGMFGLCTLVALRFGQKINTQSQYRSALTRHLKQLPQGDQVMRKLSNTLTELVIPVVLLAAFFGSAYAALIRPSSPSPPSAEGRSIRS